MFKTLFSRMLATNLIAVLLLLIFLGVTLGGMFKSQYVEEKESELRREADEINLTVASKYMDADKRNVARESLLTAARKYDALLQLYFIDPALGKVAFVTESTASKWAALSDADLTELASKVMQGGQEAETDAERFRSKVDFPLITLTQPLTAQDGSVIGAMLFHADMSRTNDSIRQVYLDVILSGCIAVILAFFAVSYGTVRISKPISDMNNTVKRFSKGDFDARVAVTSHDEVGELALSFNTMADELNSVEQTRRSFVANVSHELRSPLASMRGFLEAMQDGTIDKEDHPKYLSIVIGECNRMSGMVNDLLDLARIESGKNELKLEAFDINELIIRTLLTFEARINARGIHVEMALGDERVLVEADQAQIAQVVRNLVDNAIKFTADGGNLAISVSAGKKQAVITVSDDGECIAKEDLPHVFDRFYKGEKAHTPSGSSTGLGLSIVKRIIEQHGESITASSPPEGGASFSFTLKLYDQQGRQRPYQSYRR